MHAFTAMFVVIHVCIMFHTYAAYKHSAITYNLVLQRYLSTNIP